ERKKFKPIAFVLFIQSAHHGVARRQSAAFAQKWFNLNRPAAEPGARGISSSRPEMPNPGIYPVAGHRLAKPIFYGIFKTWLYASRFCRALVFALARIRSRGPKGS